jgi:hypothetical protein
MNLEILNGSVSELIAPFWKEKAMMPKIIVKIKILIKFYELVRKQKVRFNAAATMPLLKPAGRRIVIRSSKLSYTLTFTLLL